MLDSDHFADERMHLKFVITPIVLSFLTFPAKCGWSPAKGTVDALEADCIATAIVNTPMTSVANNQVAPAPAEEAAPAPSAGGGDDDKKQAAVRPPAKASGPEAEAPEAEAAPAELVLKTGKEASASALKKYAEVFRLFDKDGNGSIERDELALVLTSLGMAVSDGEIDRLMNAVDTNNARRDDSRTQRTVAD